MLRSFCLILIAAHLAILSPIILFASPSSAEVTRWQRVSIPVTGKRHPAFRVPEKMRPRVQFWIDIFAKYGEHHAVFHHRQRPDIIFYVLDTTSDSKTVAPNKYEAHRKAKISTIKDSIVDAIKHLATGGKPRSRLEQHVEQRMSVLGAGTKKYRDVLDNDWVRSQRGIKERYREAMERSGRYMHILEKIFVVDYGLPIELTKIPFIESSFNYKAYSSVGAAGIWQFMPVTGRQYKLKVTSVIDERRDVTAATDAAARYLTYAYRRLGAWPLAVTSYNHGVGGVSQKVKRMGTDDIVKLVERMHDQPFGFASQNFFPEILAAIEIYDNPNRYFPGVKIEKPLEIARRTLRTGMSINELVRRLGVPREELEEVNYALHSTVWSGRYSVPAGYTVNVPIAYYNNLVNLDRSRPADIIVASAGSSASTARSITPVRGQAANVSNASGTYTVKPGDSLFSIARSHRTTVQAIQGANGLSDSKIRVGQVLKLPAGIGAAPTATVVTLRQPPAEQTKEHTTLYIVKSGDTLARIARAHGVSISSIRTGNNLKGDIIKPGQKLEIRR